MPNAFLINGLESPCLDHILVHTICQQRAQLQTRLIELPGMLISCFPLIAHYVFVQEGVGP